MPPGRLVAGIDAAWTPDRTLIDRAPRRLARATAGVTSAVALLDLVPMPALVPMIAMTELARARSVRVPAVTTVVMTDHDPHHPDRAIPSEEMAETVLSVRVVRALVPMIAMTIAQGALHLGQGQRTVATIDSVARLRGRATAVMSEDAMTGLARAHRAAAAAVIRVTAMSALVRRLLDPALRIAEAIVVMTVARGRQIVRPVVVPAIRGRSVTIAARARQCAVAMTAIRSVIRGFPMTSRQRI